MLEITPLTAHPIDFQFWSVISFVWLRNTLFLRCWWTWRTLLLTRPILSDNTPTRIRRRHPAETHARPAEPRRTSSDAVSTSVRRLRRRSEVKTTPGATYTPNHPWTPLTSVPSGGGSLVLKLFHIPRSCFANYHLFWRALSFECVGSSPRANTLVLRCKIKHVHHYLKPAALLTSILITRFKYEMSISCTT